MTRASHDESCDRDLIRVVATDSEDVDADQADLMVTVEGSSLVTGTAALKKAREVSVLVAALAEVGIEQSAIGVERVEARTTSGLLSKSSSAVYTLKIRCKVIETLGDLVGAIAAQKNAQLTQVVWRYDESSEGEARRLAAATERAQVKARAVAESLGVRLLSVHRLAEGTAAPVSTAFAPAGAGFAQSKSRMSAEDLGLTVTNKKRVSTTVTVDFNVEAKSSEAD